MVHRYMPRRVNRMSAPSQDFPSSRWTQDAASDLFRDIFGDGLTGVRSVVGVASLPLGLPVELEVILEVTE